ncbi:MAG: hypothetical protein JWO38_90 [Gemmataceae bacterium]|nr:hypothetical protein [Gemmataceae bacterium]
MTARRSPLRRRVVRVGLIVLAGFATAAAVKPALARPDRPEGWAISGLDEEIRDGKSLDRELDEELADVQTRKAAKRALAADLVAGRITLAETANGFLAIDSRPPDRMALVRHGLPGRTDVEREAWSAVQHALVQIPHADEQERVRRQLEADLARLVGPGPNDPAPAAGGRIAGR